MITRYDAPEKAMCRTVGETKAAPFEFILALYADYMIHRMLDDVALRKNFKVKKALEKGI